MNFQGMGCRRVSLSVGNLGSGPFSGNSESGRRAPEMEHLSLRVLC
jgi:hypothetical protein